MKTLLALFLAAVPVSAEERLCDKHQTCCDAAEKDASKVYADCVASLEGYKAIFDAGFAADRKEYGVFLARYNFISKNRDYNLTPPKPDQKDAEVWETKPLSPRDWGKKWQERGDFYLKKKYQGGPWTLEVRERAKQLEGYVEGFKAADELYKELKDKKVGAGAFEDMLEMKLAGAFPGDMGKEKFKVGDIIWVYFGDPARKELDDKLKALKGQKGGGEGDKTAKEEFRRQAKDKEAKLKARNIAYALNQSPQIPADLGARQAPGFMKKAEGKKEPSKPQPVQTTPVDYTKLADGDLLAKWKANDEQAKQRLKARWTELLGQPADRAKALGLFKGRDGAAWLAFGATEMQVTLQPPVMLELSMSNEKANEMLLDHYIRLSADERLKLRRELPGMDAFLAKNKVTNLPPLEAKTQAGGRCNELSKVRADGKGYVLPTLDLLVRAVKTDDEKATSEFLWRWDESKPDRRKALKARIDARVAYLNGLPARRRPAYRKKLATFLKDANKSFEDPVVDRGACP